MKKVLILGGGFAGVEAAIYLRKNDFDVTMITNREYLYIYPTSIWVPTSEATFDDVCLPLKRLQEVHDFEVIIDEVESIKSSEKKVYCKNDTYEYEHLIVAIGSGKVQHKGIENTLTICGDPDDAIKMQKRIDELIQKGSGKIAMGFAGNPKDPSSVRGGPAFEVLFNVHNLLKKKGVRDNFELTFFAPMAKPGQKMGEKALKMMDIFYEKLNIKSQTGKKIVEFKENGIAFEDDIFLESDFTMFIAAGAGLEVFKNSDLPLSEAGFIKINDYCEVEGCENVYAIGDSASLEGPDWRAKQGHIAEVMARNTAYNLVEKYYGNDLRKSYKDHLNILCVMDTGDGAAFVYRSDKRGVMIPMPVVGHWMKKGWGWYYKNSKLNKIPRIPGM